MIDEINNNEKFKVTIEWIQDRYNKANQELFNGKLGSCNFKIENLGTVTLGRFSLIIPKNNLFVSRQYDRHLYIKTSYGTKIWINKENFVNLCNPTIYMNSIFSCTEEALYNTLVHEMCHYYTYMNGFCPVQAHGREFRDICSIIQYRSGGVITIQRLTDAEEMKNYDMDKKFKQQVEKRAERKKANAHYYLIVWKNGKVGLTNPTDSALKEIITWESGKKSEVKEILSITDPEITNEIYDKYGFKTHFKTYRFWSEKAGITQHTDIIKKILNNPNTYKIILKNE